MPVPVKAFVATGTILKIDPDRRQVFGWAQVAINKGETTPFFDSQGDRIPDWRHLEKAGYDFVLHSRKANTMHADDIAKATLIESMVFTPEKLEKFALDEHGDVDPATLAILKSAIPTGWWVGFQVDDPHTWARVKAGELGSFSVQGRGLRTPVADPSPAG